MEKLLKMLAWVLVLSVILIPVFILTLIWCDSSMNFFFIKLLISDLIVCCGTFVGVGPTYRL